MNFKNIKWNKTTYQEYINFLLSLEDKKYLEFNKKIVTTKYLMIGIRIPILRHIAKEISKTNIQEFINNNQDIYYEEVFIKGLVIASIKNKEIMLDYLSNYIDLIDNWSINDSIANSLKIVKSQREEFFTYFESLIATKKEYYIRLALVVYINFYIKEEYIDRIIKIILDIKTEKYYVNMAIAWCLTEIYIFDNQKVEKILNLKYLNAFVINKTIDKIRDSYRVEKVKKNYLKQWKV